MERRRTVTENVTVDFFDAEDGHTRGHFVANEDTYGSDRYWVLLKPKSVALEDFGDDPEEEELDRMLGSQSGSGAGSSFEIEDIDA